jgi:hypothetical protein
MFLSAGITNASSNWILAVNDTFLPSHKALFNSCKLSTSVKHELLKQMNLIIP